MSHIHLFISAVTDEFGSYREALLRDLNRYNLTVKTQEGFMAYGSPTLDKLDDYIRACDAVIHLVGDMTGSMADGPSLELLRKQYPDMADRMPALKDILEGKAELSYTQWEAYLAVFHGKDVYITLAEPDAKRDERFVSDPAQQQHQQAHLARLRGMHRYAEIKFASADRLVVELYRSKLTDLLNKAGRKPRNLPYHSLGSLFKGRKVFMKQLRESLMKTTAQPHASAITGKALHGLGGIGKTRLAVEYAWQHEAEYSALLFVFAGSPEALRSNLAALCGPLVLNLPEYEAQKEEVRLGAALRWLEEHPRWFLILDNVDTPESAREVERILANLHGGHVLVTSRISQWSKQVERLELDVLSVNDAAEFLLERTEDSRRKTAEDEMIARSIAIELGQLALALEQAGAYISVHRFTLMQYAKAWQASRDKLMKWCDEQQMQYPKSVAITWLTSFEQLSAATRQLINRLAWLSPEPIPESLMDESAPGDEAGDGATEALVELERYSLIARSPDVPVFAIHRLVQDVACRMMDEETREKTLEEAFTWVDGAFKGNPNDVRSWPVLEPLLPHALKVAQQADDNGFSAKASKLLSRIGLLLKTKAQYSEAEPLMRRALKIDEQSYGENHPDVAIDLNNLAQLLQATNRLSEAEPLMRRALKIDEQSYGENHPDVAIDLNNLAQLLQATNRLSEAEPLMCRALKIDEQSYGENHPDVAIDLNNLAQLLQATNRLSEAEPLMRRALKIDEQSYGENHPRVATHLNNLAQLLQAINRLSEAEPLMCRALKIDEQSYGENHPRVATHLNNLAQLLQATNRLSEAEPLMCRALKIDEQSYGENHPDVATHLNNLAILLQATNRLSEAEPLMRRALKIDEQSYGENHPDVARDLNNLAQLLQATNRLPEAEPLMRRALLIFISFQKSTGHKHPSLQLVIDNYSNLLIEVGHGEEEAKAMILSMFNEQ